MSASQYGSGLKVSVDVSKESGSSNGQPSGESSTEAADGEEQEDSSSSIAETENSLEDTLDSFRKQWQKELEISPPVNQVKYVEENFVNESYQLFDDGDVENQAKKWYLQGVEHEQRGKLYEAIQFYRRAVQLVPDIEFKLYDSYKVKTKERTETEGSEESIDTSTNYVEEERDDEDLDDDTLDMITRLQRFVSRSRAVCSPQYVQKQTHVSSLPTEIILYILRWVVSTDLDFRSLEMFSMVCRGFYLCSRDPELWRLACLRVWGVNCGGLTNYDSWREMFIQRPRLNYNGCYISKTTYIRHGENSFQDQFYRPWHLVEYFRYLRFFPEGTVLMLTTPDEPVPSITLLKSRHARSSSVLVGHYRLHDDKVTLVMKRQEAATKVINNRFRNKRNRDNAAGEILEQCFQMELQILPYKRKINSQLSWLRYSVITKKGSAESCNNFEMIRARFPPFWFSRVKSYTAESEGPLM